jgi:hypothetical protein
MNRALTVLFASSLSLAGFSQEKLGYDDTPMLPGEKWHVHDGKRPQPKVITGATGSTNEKPGTPPSDAIVLFDGVKADAWAGGDNGKGWQVVDGALVASKQDLLTRQDFGSVHLHVEYSGPKPPRGSGQGRSNSGIFFMGQYEIQVLDGYENKTYPDGMSGSVYGQHPPLVNASLPPGEWNTLDIFFTAPKFKDDKSLEEPAYVTVIHNGVLIQNHVKLFGAAAHRKRPEYTAHPEKGPILLQALNSGMRYRNIWVRPINNYDNEAEGGAIKPPRPDGKKVGDF